MKKLILLISICLFSLVAVAQLLTPRFGTGYKDNTGRVLTYGYINLGIDSIAKDTVVIKPDAFETIVKDSLIVDSLHLAILTQHACLGDEIICIFKTNSTPHKVYFQGYVDCVIYSSNKITIPASGWAIIVFIWDGKTWAEVSRSWNS